MSDSDFIVSASGLGGQGSLLPKDILAFAKGANRVYTYMLDMQWHTRAQIDAVSGQVEGTRRMRQLRQLGFYVEAVRVPGGDRVWNYRLVGFRRGVTAPIPIPKKGKKKE